MGLQTEAFHCKNALPEGILSMLTDRELELFTGERWEIGDSKKVEWRNCQRIEINAIKVRDRPAYLERKIGEALQRLPGAAAAPQRLPTRPPLGEMVELAHALIQRSLRDRARAAIEERIKLQEIEAAALATLPPLRLRRGTASDLGR